MRTGALLLIGIGSALVIITVLAVLLVPSGRRRQPPSFTRDARRAPLQHSFLHQRARCSRV